MKWVDEQLEPVVPGRRNDVQEFVAELQRQPGRWAELDRYGPARAKTAYSRGSNIAKRHAKSRVQYAVKVDEASGETVLYLRVEPE